MRSLSSYSTLFVVSGLLSVCPASAQDLTIERALAMAKANNGTVQAAFLDYQASRASAMSARSSYSPTLTPSYQYETNRLETFTGPGQGLFDDNSSTTLLTASWLLFDSGGRDANYLRSRYSRDASESSALQTLRRVLFGVHSSFYEALRADELLNVSQAQLTRAREIEKQARDFAEYGSGAKKDVLQATADALNAKANEITARNAVSTSRANLKAVLGLQERDGLAPLVAPEEQVVEGVDYTLQDALDAGLKDRPDLESQRARVGTQKQSVRLAEIDRGLTWTLDARHVRAFSPDPFDRSALVFQISIPLFDGMRSDSNLRASKLTLDAQRATLTQAERDAIAEIESAYKEFSQNIERLEAATAAREASRVNYDAVFEARKEGAADLIELLTAQVSLATAESNYIQAFYDTIISRVRLRLVTGQTMPGEGE